MLRSTDRATRIAGACGVAGPLVFAASWLTAGALTPGYRSSSQAISELAATGAPAGPIMNGGFVAFGVLTGVFAWGLARVLGQEEAGAMAGGHPRPRLATAPYAAAVTAVGTVLVAAFPCSPGCPGPLTTYHDFGHALTAGTAYLTLGLTPLLAAAELRDARRFARRFRRFSRACGALTLVGFALWAAGAAGGSGGLLQRGFTTVGHLWIASAGAAIALRRLGGDGGDGPGVARYSSGASESSGALS